MNKINVLSPVAVFTLGLLMIGCGGRDVEVTGEAKSGATVDGPITIEFFETGDSADAEAIDTLELAKLGPFTRTVSVDGDTIRIHALADADKNGACTDGEAWAEAEATVKDDGTVDPVTLELKADPCPAAETAAK